MVQRNQQFAAFQTEEELDNQLGLNAPNWQPSFSKKQTQDYIKAYKQDARQFNPPMLRLVTKHAKHHRIPFAYNAADNEASLQSIIGNFSTSLVEGFTTAKISNNPPTNTADAIAKNLGHLAGFIGYIPVIGKGPIARFLREQRGKSIPLRVGKFARRKATKYANKAIDSKTNALIDGFTVFNQPVGAIGKDMAQGALELGVASAFSSWREGVDGAFQALIGGGLTGGAFRGLGNLIQGFGPQGDKALRGIASSIFEGLPAQQAGLTTPEIIYSYLLGAYFGYNEMPFHVRKGGSFLKKAFNKDNRDKPVEEVPGFERLDNVTQKYVIRKHAEIPKGTFITEAFLKQLEREGLLKLPTEKEINKRLEEIRKLEQDQRLAEQKDIKIEDLVETERARADKEGTKDFEQDNYDFEVPTIKLSIKNFVDNRMKTVLDASVKKEGFYGKIKTYQKVQKEWDRLVELELAKDKPGNPSDKMLEWMSSRKGFNTSFTDLKDINFWRGWGNRTIKAEPVSIFSINISNVKNNKVVGIKTKNYDKRQFTIISSKELIDSQGNEPVLLEEPKIIDIVYNRAFDNFVSQIRATEEGSLSQQKGQRAYQVLDTVQITRGIKKDGTPILDTVSLGDLEGYFGKNIYKGQANLQKEGYKDFLSNIQASLRNEMAKQGYYYFGGKGDAHRQYFVKLHPLADMQVRKKLTSQKFLGLRGTEEQITREFQQRPGIKNLSKSTNIKTILKDEFGFTSKELRGVDADADFLSNLYYAKELNYGESFFNANIPKRFWARNSNMNNPNLVVKNVKDFNKRQQIWFTSGHEAELQFLRRHINDLTPDGKFRYALVIGPETEFINQDKLTNKAKNSQFNESEDGGIPARYDVIEGLNREAGIPFDGFFNKSFIVSPDAVYGGLIGKYGMHSVTEAENAYMMKKNIHFIVNALSAKASGTRTYQSYEWNNKTKEYDWFDLKFDRKGEKIISRKPSKNNEPVIYEMDVSHVKTVPSEIATEKAKFAQRIPKQIYTNLTRYSKEPIDQKDIDDFIRTTMTQRIAGLDESNKLMNAFLANPDRYLKTDYIDNLVDNHMDRMGISLFLDGLSNNTKGGHEFASKAYAKILRVNKVIEAEKLLEDGETAKRVETELKNLSDFESIHERLLRINEGKLSGSLHKFVTPMRGAAIRNYVINELTKPKMDNSLSVRMRIMTRAMKFGEFTSVLEKSKGDEYFFLDEGFRDFRLKTDFTNQTNAFTLGELWDVIQKYKKTPTEKVFGKNIKGRTDVDASFIRKANEVLNALAVRVPMDSMSGAAVLKFGGFTGARGLGGLIHGRTMKKLGGADLDGDKMTIFFGDETHGFHKKWKNMFKKQRDEYLNKDGTEKNNKTTIIEVDGKKIKVKDVFTDTDEFLEEIVSNPVYAYSSSARLAISRAAATGRERLGSAVSNKAAITAVHSEVGGLPARKIKLVDKKGKTQTVNVPKDTYVYEVEHIVRQGPNKGKKIKVPIFMTAKTDPKSLEEFRLRARAAIALGSDPMDEAGLASRERFFQELVKPMFTFKHVNPKKHDKINLDDYKEIPFLRMKGINNVLYGRNHPANRRWYAFEIRNSLEAAFTDPAVGPDFLYYDSFNNRNSFLAKIGDEGRRLDFSESIFKRLNFEGKGGYFELYNQFQKDLKSKNYKWLQEILQRRSMAVPHNQHIRRVLEHELFTYEGYQRQLNPNVTNNKDKRMNYNPELFKGYGPIEDTKAYKEYLETGFMSRKVRENFLNDYVKAAEDFIINDLADFTSIKLIKQYADIVGNPERILKIHRDSESFKNASADLYKEGKTDIDLAKNLVASIEDPANKKIKTELESILDMLPSVDKESSITKRADMDSRIKRYKNNELETKAERDLFDQFMLGTLNRGRMESMNTVLKRLQNLTGVKVDFKPGTKRFDELSDADFLKIQKIDGARALYNSAYSMYLNSAGTSLVRLGFSSPSISENSLKTYFNDYNKLFSSVELPKEKIIKEAETVVENIDKKQTITDADGNKIKIGVLSSNDFDIKTQKYLDEIAPFEGLAKGTLTKEEATVKNEILDSIRHYFGGRGALPGVELNGLARHLVGKDLNAMNYKDYVVFNNYLKDFREGHFIAKLFGSAKYFPEYGKDPSKPLKGFPELGRRFYYLFPEAVNKELQMFELNLVDKTGVYKDKLGNTFSGNVKKPTQIINQIRDTHHYAQQSVTAEYEKQIASMDNDLSHYISVEDGVSLYKVQAAMRERFGLISEASNLDKVTPEYGFLNDGKRGSNEKQAKLFEYNKVFRETINSANWHKIKNKIYIVNLPKELGGTKKMTGLEISQKIFEQVTKHNKRFYDILVGKEEVYRKYTDIVEKETDPKKIIQSLDKLAEVFAKDVQDAINTETPLNPNIGMDPLRRITKYLQLRQLKDSFQGKNILDPETGELFGTDAFVREIQNVPKQIEKTGEIPFDFYFPHMMFERKAVGESLRRQIKAIIKDLDSNNPAIVRAKRKELTNIMIRHKQLTGDWFTDTELTNRYTDINKILSGIGEKRKDLLDEGFKNFLKNRRVGNQFKRESHLGGFSYDPLAYNNYVKNILNTFYRQIGEISSNDAIYTFRKQKSSQIGQELTNRWTEYLQLYSNEASGAPVNIPNHVLNDPGMKIKGTLYAQFADNLWVKRMNKLRDKLGLRGKTVTEFVEVVEKANNPIIKVISGGQTGIDEMFLKIAKSNNIKTGGTAPPDWERSGRRDGVKETREERKKLLQGYGLVEGEPDRKKYPKRTKKNVRDADGTIAFMPQPSVGTGATIRYAETGRWGKESIDKDGIKPILVIKNLQDKKQAVKDIQDFIETNNLKTINGAGPREDKFTKNQEQDVQSILNDVFKRKIDKVERKEVRKQTDDTIPPELKDWDFGSLKAFSSFDARYNLMSLLAHPKSAVTNLFGGTVHTLASTGLENFRNARDINYLRSKVNKEWTSMGDVYNWVKSHGVVEDFLLYELQINPNVQGRKMQTALKEAFQKIKKNPDFKDKDLLDIAKRNGISATVFNKAAWFMRAPERILRRDAFVAHYLQAKRKFDGLIQDYNNPYLIDMAKKGVKGTQFLYSAPFRPAFARSSMGKIFSRFQLWGYNSVRFRNDALREAKIYGFEGEAMKRAERIFMADMMMFGLAGMFPLSIFETALPAPWNYMQDMSDLMFGDEKERDRAFYGTYPRALAPLQVVTPPSLRLLPPLFKAIVEDDYGRLSDYHMWAAAPYGRLARSVVGPGGILNNPTRMVETMTGFPLLSLSKITRDAKKIDLPSPGDDAKYVY